MNWKAQDRELQIPQGEVLPYLLEHDPAQRQDADVWPGQQVCLRLRTEAGVLGSGEAVTQQGGTLHRFPLTRVHTDAALEVWQAIFTAESLDFEYFFRLETVTGRAYLGNTGLQGSLPHPARFRFAPRSPLEPPAWAQGATFYQIFPDRFERLESGTANALAWDAPTTVQGFKDGTLSGITARLEHLHGLGVEVIYLTPIFASPSTHRYDTTDFFAIDPRLGNEQDLRELVGRAHALGLRVILDGVFNHVSEHHPFFVDVLARGPDSPHWDWFEMGEWPVTAQTDAAYSMWWGFPHLPELRVEHPEVQRYLLKVATHWLQVADVDGWRLDVAGELPLSFWQDLRREVLGVKPDAYLLGEYWGDARQMLQGDSFDAAMNYPFRRSVLGFLSGEWDAPATARALSRLYWRLPRAAAETQYNLLGSHDTPRVRTVLGGDAALVGLAFALQVAYPGTPALYYGDELGLHGGEDPDCRRTYPWSEAHAAQEGTDADLHAEVRRLYRWRRASPVLRCGDFRCQAPSPDVLSIERRLGEQVITLTLDRAARTAHWSEVNLPQAAPQEVALERT
ncbi:glycoside hydrolase family 13 protein [Deinococcus sp.]|uniref:glycoside hydrolase family 13 protein n=1 Tax=Deinococcus sp. TaxID=47478 RepID=UPI003B5A238B